MNPDSKTYTVRSLVSKKAAMLQKPACLPCHGTERVITPKQVRNPFPGVKRRFWQIGLSRGITKAISEVSKKESGTRTGIDMSLPAIFFKQLIENN